MSSGEGRALRSWAKATVLGLCAGAVTAIAVFAAAAALIGAEKLPEEIAPAAAAAAFFAGATVSALTCRRVKRCSPIKASGIETGAVILITLIAAASAAEGAAGKGLSYALAGALTGGICALLIMGGKGKRRRR